MIRIDALEIESRLVRGRIRATAGRAALTRALQHITSSEIAARVGVHKSNVSRWVSRVCSPSARAQAALFRVYGIAVELWDKPSARPVSQRQQAITKEGDAP